jgi:Mg/Co/Ni transporter MgtE
MMNTEYISLHEGATVEDALRALRGNEDQLESLNSLYLVDSEGRLTGTVPVARLFVAANGKFLKELAAETLISASVDEKQDEVTELFDKYNLLALPIVDEDKRLTGVITADDIISVLRHK